MKPPKTPRPPRWWDPFAAILLIAALQTAVLRLVATHWTPELEVVQVIVLGGVVLGLALGYSRFSPLLAFCFELGYGVFVIPWRLVLLVGADLPWTERLLVVLNRIGLVIVQIVTDKFLTDSILFVILMACLFWALSVHAGFNLVRHAHSWRTILPTGLVVFVIHFYNNCPYNKKISICADPNLSIGAWYLAAFLFFALVFLARSTYLQRAAQWRQNQAHISPEVGYDLMRYALGLAVVIILLSWIVPALPVNPVPLAAQLWEAAGTPARRISDLVGPFFESIRSPVGIQTDDFGQSLSLGQGGELSDNPSLFVEAPGAPSPGVPFYWRNRVYDQYVDGTWKSTFTMTLSIEGGSLGEMNLPATQQGAEVTFKFRPTKSLFVLYAPRNPVAANLPIEVEYAQNTDQTVDVAAIKASELLGADDSYQVRAVIRNITIEELRASRQNYPAWVTERYLQIPATITPRMRQLAQDIIAGLQASADADAAAGSITTYDKVQAITDYLRENLEYAAVIDAIPAGREPLDWVLFDYKKGFCNFYASSEVILLRSLGIPARLVVGYAQGESTTPVEEGLRELNYQRGIANTGPQNYVVRGRDAHAWPEVYFPNVGWVEFEPTASRVAILRPSGASATASANTLGPLDLEQAPIPTPPAPPLDGPLFPDAAPSPIETILGQVKDWALRLWWLEALLLAAALFVWWAPLLVKLEATLRELGLRPPKKLSQWAEIARRQQRIPLAARIEASLRRLGVRPPQILTWWAKFASLSPIARAYLEINHALQRLGQPPSIEDTPAERVAALAVSLPEVRLVAANLLAEYQADAYSSHAADERMARRCANEIRKLSRLAWFQRLLVGKPQKRPGLS